MKQEITPERWQQIEQVYHAALACQEDQRAEYLRTACSGDHALRQEVESLLAQDGNGFLDAPAQFSPVGHWIAYQSTESGRSEIYVRPFSGTASEDVTSGEWQVSNTGGVAPHWRSDGNELYYIAPDGKMMAVPIAFNGATLQPGTPTALFQTRIYGGGMQPNLGGQFDVSRDGRFLINTVLPDAASPIILLQNWTPGLKK